MELRKASQGRTVQCQILFAMILHATAILLERHGPPSTSPSSLDSPCEAAAHRERLQDMEARPTHVLQCSESMTARDKSMALARKRLLPVSEHAMSSLRGA